MKLYSNFCKYISEITTINENFVSVILLTILIFLLFYLIKIIVKMIIKRKMTGRSEYVLNQTFQILINIFEVLFLLLLWAEYIKNLMTLISVLSAAMTIALREIILNFFCGIYIKFRKPFKVEDRIQIDEIKGDVMNISALDFEILEVSTKEENGQSTGVVVNFPNSFVFSKPIRNINKGFKYIWSELNIKIILDSDLNKNKQEIYKIINSIDIIKNIPIKMKNQVKNVNFENRVYFNNYNPVIYTKIVNNYILFTVRYLMHPKKARFVESEIWNKIYERYKDKKLDLYF